MTFRLPARSASAGGSYTETDVYSTPDVGQIQPGTTFNFQAWFRDSAAMLSGFDLSGGVSVTFQPEIWMGPSSTDSVSSF